VGVRVAAGGRAKPGRRGRTQTQPSETGVAARIRQARPGASGSDPATAGSVRRFSWGSPRSALSLETATRAAQPRAVRPARRRNRPSNPKAAGWVHVTESPGALHAGAVAPRGPRGGLRMVPRAASASSAPRSATQRRAWVLPSLGGRMLRTGWGVGELFANLPVQTTDFAHLTL